MTCLPDTRVRKFCLAIVILLFVSAAIVVPIVVVKETQKNKNNDDEYTSGTNGSIIVPSNFTNNVTSNNTMGISVESNWINDNWNMSLYLYGKENFLAIDNDTFRVTYVAKSGNPSAYDTYGGINGGILFYATPSVFPTEEVYLSYQVKFGDNQNFNWVKGGMLPGVWIGQRGAYDGKKPDNGSSARIMWRTNGMAEAYLYVDPQDEDFEMLPGYADNTPFGQSIYRGFGRFNSGQWNQVTMHIRLNTVNMNDGLLSLSVNNRVFSYTKMNWRKRENEKINGIMVNSFFGGSDISWTTPTDQYIYFKNMTVYV